LAAACLQIVEYLEPEHRAFGLLDPQSQHVARAIGRDAESEGDGLVAHDPIGYKAALYRDHSRTRSSNSTPTMLDFSAEGC
jgi:hypothetical protein